MASESLVSRMFQKELEKDYIKGFKNLAGGYATTALDVAQLPAQAASAAIQFIGNPANAGNITIPTPTAPIGEAMQEKTGIPYRKASEPAYKPVFDFGQGAAFMPTPATAALGGGLNVAAEQFFPDSPFLKALINSSPMLTGLFAGLGSAIRGGSMRKIDSKQGDTILDMSKGKASGNLNDIATENWLKTQKNSAPIVKANTKMFSMSHEEFLRRYFGSHAKDEDVGEKAALAWTAFRKHQLASHARVADADFRDAFKFTGDKEVAEVGNVRDFIKDLIKQYETMGKGGPDADTAKTMLKEQLKVLEKGLGKQKQGVQWEDWSIPTKTKAEQPKLNLRDLQEQLMYWGKLINATDSPLKKIAPGAQKGIEKKIYSLLEESLDNVALEKGAVGQGGKALKQARQAFANRASDLEEMEKGVGKHFYSLTDGRPYAPEEVMENLRKLDSREREYYTAIMEMRDPQRLDDLRQNIFNKWIDEAGIAGGMQDPVFSAQKWLQIVDKNKKDLEWLLPTKEKRELFNKTHDDFKKIVQGSPVRQESLEKPIENIGSGLTAMASGSLGASAASRGVTRTIADFFSDKAALAQRYFGQNAQPASKTGRAIQTIQEAVRKTPNALPRSIAPSGMLSPALESLDQNPAQIKAEERARLIQQIPGAQEDDDLAPEVKEILDLAPEVRELFGTDSAEKKSQSNIDSLLDNIKRVESSGDPLAVSKKGALGPYQLMPDTAKFYNVDNPFEDGEARKAAKAEVESLMKKYNGDVRKVLAAYNWGQGNLDKFGIEKAPEETHNYIKKVLNE